MNRRGFALFLKALLGGADQTLRQALKSLVGSGAPAETRRLVDFILSSEMETEYSGSADQLSAFWPDDVDWIEYIPATHGEWTEWVSFTKATGKPVLLGFLAADVAAKMETLSDREIVSGAMAVLRTIYGIAIPDPVEYQITRWGSDPFARGSYSFNAVNSTPTMRSALAAPLGGRLFFAGEATEKTLFATAHGAYLSGLRAADEMG